jgi:hypothetical protein
VSCVTTDFPSLQVSAFVVVLYLMFIFYFQYYEISGVCEWNADTIRILFLNFVFSDLIDLNALLARAIKYHNE